MLLPISRRRSPLRLCHWSAHLSFHLVRQSLAAFGARTLPASHSQKGVVCPTGDWEEMHGHWLLLAPSLPSGGCRTRDIRCGSDGPSVQRSFAKTTFFCFPQMHQVRSIDGCSSTKECGSQFAHPESSMKPDAQPKAFFFCSHQGTLKVATKSIFDQRRRAPPVECQSDLGECKVERCSAVVDWKVAVGISVKAWTD